ncbi:hypothetical protein YC2023_043212 [Brassica napus]
MELECGLGDKLEIGKLVIGLERTKELVGNGNDDLKNETMEFDVTGTHVEGKEEFICGGEDFQALTDGEVEEIVMLQEDTRVITDGADELGGNVDHGILAGDDEKKKGARKALFKKTTAVAVGTSKMRFVQTVLSPRKNAPVKTGKRQGEGEGAKQTEDKGPSNPKPTSSKPLIESHGELLQQFWSLVSLSQRQPESSLFRIEYGDQGRVTGYIFSSCSEYLYHKGTIISFENLLWRLLTSAFRFKSAVKLKVLWIFRMNLYNKIIFANMIYINVFVEVQNIYMLMQTVFSFE